MGYSVLEGQVVDQVVSHLSYRGWRAVKHTIVPGQFRAGEPGMPDYEFIRYLEQPGYAALIFWVEFKSPEDQRKCRCLARQKQKKRGLCTVCLQKKWRMNEERLGAVVRRVNDFGEFERWYSATFSWLHTGEAARGQLSLTEGLHG